MSKQTFLVRGLRLTDQENETVDLGQYSDLFERPPAYQEQFVFSKPERGSTSSESVEDHELQAVDSDLIEVEYENGSRRWMTVERARNEFGVKPSRGSNQTVIAEESFAEVTERGLIKSAVKGLKFLGLDLEDWAGDKFAGFLSEKLEKKACPAPGLYRIEVAEHTSSAKFLANSDNVQLVDAGDISTEQPILLFIHGTGSSFFNGYFDLWHLSGDETKNSDQKNWGRQRLNRWLEFLGHNYADRIYAFEHRTLSESPISNTIDLLNALPDKARLHIISHSRGGLIGELLCRGRVPENGRGKRIDDHSPFTDQEIEAYGSDQKPGRDQQQIELKKLNGLLKEKGIDVERFVRVACPARGTTLADGKLDDWLSGFTSLLERFLPIENNDIYYLLKTLTIGVVKAKADPSMLPGIEAMMTDSAMISLINAGPKVAADLSMIAGQTQAEGWIPWMWPLDRFYKNQYFPEGRNDLVVPTLSMQQGHPRDENARIYNDKGANVNHFNYFKNRNSFDRLVAALERGENEDAGFTTIQTRPEVTAISRGAELKGPHPRVIIVPGITGSHIKRKDDRIWLQYHEIIFGALDELAMGQDEVAADGFIASYYEDLARYLEATHKVIRFSYDWRDSILKSGERLSACLEQALNDDVHPDQPVHIIAHSMGGLVSRAMIHQNKNEVWNQFKQNSANHLIMMGTPNNGAYAIARMLMGRDSMIRMLSRFDIRHSQEELLGLFNKFPGVLSLLPQDEGWDFRKPDTWRRMKNADQNGEWSLPKAQDLNKLESIWECLKEHTIDTKHMYYVAGKSPVTVSEMKVSGSGARGKVEFLGNNLGDGRVPWKGGIPQALIDAKHVWYMPVIHGDLCRHKPAFPALLDLLTLGETSRLAKNPPGVRGDEKPFVVPDDRLPFFPDQDMLMAAGMGSSLAKESSTTVSLDVPVVRVSITHGDLNHVDRPILAGHYSGDTLISAEAALDRKFNGELSQIRRLGVYPGPVGSSEMILERLVSDENRYYGAIIVGLGQIGELLPSQLRTTLKQGLIRYARAVAMDEAGKRTDPELVQKKSLEIATLLIGSGRGGVTLSESIQEILNAVRETNESLNRQKVLATIIDLEFIELYEDTAIITGKKLQDMAARADMQDAFVFEPVIREGESGHRRDHFEETPGWWRRIQILSQNDGSLKYTTPTDKARVEVTVQKTQRRLIDNFLRDANRLQSRDKALEQALFELLIPNKMKDQVPDQKGLVLMLDDATARYPWEMLNDFRSRKKSSDQDEPMAVTQSIVRQLHTDKYRQKPVSILENSALVIGDPVSRYVPLPGAQEEARHVSESLRKYDFAVNSLIGKEASADNVIKALYSKGVRVLHLSGHGVYELPVSNSQTMTGMVLGNDIFLTTTEVEQLRVVPELVFINCCLLGKIEPQKRNPNPELFNERATLAANLATQFIYMGARAVVAAGWEVDDNAAQVFAQTFYEAMLNGEGFGNAVQKARAAAYKEHGRSNTWGAYQCYGDPDYELIQQSSVHHRSHQRKRYVSFREPLIEIENIISAAKQNNPGNRENQLSRLANIEDETPKLWMTRSAKLPEKLGQAYAELYDFKSAIRCYEAALNTDIADHSVQVIEQRANLKARMALELSQGNSVASARRDIREAIADLKKLAAIKPTPERLSLLGSGYKGLAKLEKRRSAQRTKALNQAAEYYFNANDEAVLKNGKNDPYSLINAIMIAQAIRTDKTPSEIDKLLKQLNNQLAPGRASGLWEKIARCDLALLNYLQDSDRKTADRKNLTKLYQHYLKSASDRERNSVIEQIEFLVEIERSKALQDEIREIVNSLKKHDR